MEEEKDVFYVVRKGNLVAIYNSLIDCQAQVGSSVLHPPVSVFKGYCLPKETEKHLASHGLKNSLYSISAANVTDDLFGQLLPCPFQQPPPSIGIAAETGSPSKRMKNMLEAEDFGFAAASDTLDTNFPKQFNPDSDFKVDLPSSLSNNFKKLFNSNDSTIARATSSVCQSCVLEFDGSSKGNPGPAGAGALLRPEDERWVCKLQEGLGIATNNVAEYRALILGLRHALEEGFKHIRVVGDSKLVCYQIQGIWKINQEMANLCKDAMELKDKFLSFQINHIPRDSNHRADDLANHAVNLRDGEVVINCKIK